MTIQCSACLSDNPDNSNHCGVCGYQINKLKSGNKNHSGINLDNGILLKN